MYMYILLLEIYQYHAQSLNIILKISHAIDNTIGGLSTGVVAGAGACVRYVHAYLVWRCRPVSVSVAAAGVSPRSR